MGGDYFCDVLDCSDKRMDYDFESMHKQDDLKTMTLKIKSAPTKGLSLSNGADMVRGKGAGAWDFKHKSELKYSCANAQYQTKIVASNKDFTLGVTAEPASLNETMQTSFEVEAKCIPQKQDWETKVQAKVSGFQVGPISPFTEVSTISLLIPSLD